MTDEKDSGPDMEKIKAELAESAVAARKRLSATAQAYHEAMEKLAEQLRKLKKSD